MAEFINYMYEPGFDVRLQRLASLRPDQKALINTALEGSEFADVEMKKKLFGEQFLQQDKLAERKLSLQEKELGLEEDLFREASSMQKLAQTYTLGKVGEATDIAKLQLGTDLLSLGTSLYDAKKEKEASEKITELLKKF